MQKTNLRIFFLMLALLAASILCACSDDGGDDEDGDADGDSDTPATDGDDDTTPPDGDSDDPAGRCTAAADTLCFDAESGDLAGNYIYVKHGAIPSGCRFLQSGAYHVDMYEAADKWSTFTVAVEDWNGPGEYHQNTDSVSLKWDINTAADGESPVYDSYSTVTPCTIEVFEEEKSGAFDCTLIKLEDSAINFKVSGAWNCSAMTE